MKNLLFIHYGPGPESVSGKFVEKICPIIKQKYSVEEVDLLKDQPIFFDKLSMSAYIKRNYKGIDLTEEETKSLVMPDKLTDQVIKADLLLIVFPMYNFSIPGIVKTWIDNVAQAKKLFKYTEYGPTPLSKMEKAIVIPITGSTPEKSSKDFITPYMDFILKFIGAEKVIFKGIHGTKFLGESVEKRLEEIIKDVEEEIGG